MEPITWNEVWQSGQKAWKTLKGFFRDKLTDPPDLSNLEIIRDYEQKEDIDDLFQDGQDKIKFDMALDQYVSNRIESIEKARKNKKKRDRAFDR